MTNPPEPRATKRSSDVALMTSFRRTPPQAHLSAPAGEQAAPSSESASKPGPFRPPNVRMSKVSPFPRVKLLVKSIERPPSSLVSLVVVSAPYCPKTSPAKSKSSTPAAVESAPGSRN